MALFEVNPDSHRQFGTRNAAFFLLTQAERVQDFHLVPSNLYTSCVVTGLEPEESLEDALTNGHVPPDADVLAVCPGRFLSSPGPVALGETRKLSVMPCGSTPITDAQLAYFLGVVERTDPDVLAERCERLFADFEESATINVCDDRHETVATFAPWGDYEWNQQGGPLEAGEQQIAPAGEASALPADIAEFDPSRRLGLDGTLALHGRPIVHRGDQPEAIDAQARLFADLDAVSDAALLINVTGGLVTACRPQQPDAKPAADALSALFADDERYAVVWEFGIGLNTDLVAQRGNCGLNEMFGGRTGVLHLGFGLTPTTTFALTFACADTILTTPTGRIVAGPAGRPGLNRRRAAGCGCS